MKLQTFLTSNNSKIKHARVIAYLVISGLLGYLLAQIANNEMLTVIFAPAINYALYILADEIKENKS